MNSEFRKQSVVSFNKVKSFLRPFHAAERRNTEKKMIRFNIK